MASIFKGAAADSHMNEVSRRFVATCSTESSPTPSEVGNFPQDEPQHKRRAGGVLTRIHSILLFVAVALLIFGADRKLHEISKDNAQKYDAHYFCFEVCMVVLGMMLPAVLFQSAGGKMACTKAKMKHVEGPSSGPARCRVAQVQASPRVEPPKGLRVEAQQEPQAERELRRSIQLLPALRDAAQQADLRRAEQLLEKALASGAPVDASCFNYVIHICARKGDIRRAQRWLREMRAVDVAPNTISYNMLMDACAKGNDASAAEHWFNEAVAAGVEVNEVSYATVIHARANMGDLVQAEQWLRKMVAAGVEPNIVSYNSLIFACGRRGNIDAAEHWMEEVESKGLLPRVTTYTALVDACAKCGDVERAESWMERMMARNIRPNVISFSAMIDTCAKAGSLDKARHWHSVMAEHDVAPNAHTYSILINACAKLGDVSAAVKLLVEMQVAGVEADVVIYSGVIDACAKAGDVEGAKDIFDRMRAAGVTPNVITYVSLARPYAHRGKWQQVEALAQEMETEYGLAINEYFLYMLLVSYAVAKPRQSDRAEMAYRHARSMGVQINRHVTGALVRAVGRARCHQLQSEL